MAISRPIVYKTIQNVGEQITMTTLQIAVKVSEHINCNTLQYCKSLGCPEGCAICSTSTDCQKCSNYTHYLANQLIAAAKCVPSCEEVGLLSYINSTNQRRYCYGIIIMIANVWSCDHYRNELKWASLHTSLH